MPGFALTKAAMSRGKNCVTAEVLAHKRTTPANEAVQIHSARDIVAFAGILHRRLRRAVWSR
jgi:hypothetical protein